MTSDEILEEITEILDSKWTSRDGRKVPEPEDINLGNDAVTLDGTVLYADMSDSTDLVSGYKAAFAAKIYKSYLIGACRVIRNNGGEITAFDGDRVMAVFIGTAKNSDAAKTALQINFIVREINKAVKKQYPNTSYILKHKIGIDTSHLFVARTGIRNSNDLVWIGRSANYAAKLCELADSSYPIYITEDVYSVLNDNSKKGGNPKENMWEKRIWTAKGVVVYRSSWYWPF